MRTEIQRRYFRYTEYFDMIWLRKKKQKRVLSRWCHVSYADWQTKVTESYYKSEDAPQTTGIDAIVQWYYIGWI